MNFSDSRISFIIIFKWGSSNLPVNFKGKSYVDECVKPDPKKWTGFKTETIKSNELCIILSFQDIQCAPLKTL